MTDKKENIILRNSQINYDDFSQFKEFNYEEALTPIQERLYFLMLHSDIARGDNESLYGWCGRLGLSNSTIFGIFKKNNKNMHLSVAEKISQATGADALWIKDGIGEPFPNQSHHTDATDTPTDNTIEMPANNYKNNDIPPAALEEFTLKLNLLEEATNKIIKLDIPVTLQISLRDIIYAIDTQNTDLLKLTLEQLIKNYDSTK